MSFGGLELIPVLNFLREVIQSGCDDAGKIVPGSVLFSSYARLPIGSPD
jgi:hypothetical protein